MYGIIVSAILGLLTGAWLGWHARESNEDKRETTSKDVALHYFRRKLFDKVGRRF